MANITRFNPLNELSRFDPIMDVNNFFKGFWLRPLMQAIEREPEMKMDVSETDGSYVVKNKNSIAVS